MNKTKLLNEIFDYKYATPNNFYSRNGKTFRSSVVQLRKDFADLRNSNFIEEIPTKQKWNTRNEIRDKFWCITEEGSIFIEREEEFKKFRKPVAVRKMQHESAIRDICRSFRLLDPQARFIFDYDFKGVKPDIVVMTKDKKYFVEVERKAHYSAIRPRKIESYEKIKCNIPVLLVFSNLDWDTTLRPQEYGNHQEELELLRENFQKFLKKHASDLPNYRYKFLLFPHFNRLDEKVWFLPNGHRVNYFD